MTTPPPISRQNNLDVAIATAIEAVVEQSDEQLSWLGAVRVGDAWRIAVLDRTLELDTATGSIISVGPLDIGPHWRILALHYLAIRTQPAQQSPTISFAHLPAAQAYSRVYQGRVLGRLCATAGRDAKTLTTAAGALGARTVDAGAGDLAFDFDLFPRITVRLIWHAPDEEFGPSATLLLPANIEDYFCIEDIVVLSERLVSRLEGR